MERLEITSDSAKYVVTEVIRKKRNRWESAPEFVFKQEKKDYDPFLKFINELEAILSHIYGDPLAMYIIRRFETFAFTTLRIVEKEDTVDYVELEFNEDFSVMILLINGIVHKKFTRN